MTAFGHTRLALLGSAAAIGFAALPASAQAQDLDEGDGDPAMSDNLGGADIIVRARRQDETLQEVPVTVAVINEETLERYNVDQVEDVISRVPTLNVQVGGSGSGGQLSLRGVGSSNISAAFDSAVAFDFDGVQVSTMRLVQPGFFDTAQIDILKGPQSLFFGKSASAGVFSIRSADPTPTWEFGANASYEFEEKGYLVGGFISGPISDALGIRIAAQYNDIQEYVQLEPGTPTAHGDARGLEDFVGRVTLAWNPFSGFDANLKVQYSRLINDGAIGPSDVFCGANGVADPIVLLGGTVAIPAGYDCDIEDGEYSLVDTAPPLAQQVPPPSEAVGYNGVPFGETDLIFGRLQFNFGLTDALTLTSTTGYVDLDATDVDNYGYGGVGPAFSPLGNAIGQPLAAFAPALAAINGPNVPLGVGTSDPRNTLEQYSQEFRLTTDFDGAINLMLGAFYESRTFGFDTAQQAVNISLIAPDPITGNTFDYDKIQTTDTEAISFFGSLAIELTDTIEVSGGVRYTEEEKVSVIDVPYVHFLLSSGPAFIDSGFFSGPIRFEDDNLSPEATIRWLPSDDITLFASFKTGFKSGGIDNSALPSSSLLGFDDPDPAVRQRVADSLIYQSETAIGGEVGIKSQFDNRNLTLNATAFYYVFDDLQVQNFDATTIQFITLNAGEVTQQGLDFSAAYNTPLPGLSFSGNLTYLDAEFSDSFVTAAGIDIEGRDAPRAPMISGNFAVDYAIALGDALDLTLSGNVLYSDEYFTDQQTFDDFIQDDFVTFDAAVSIGDPDRAWKLSLVGVNLTDEIFTNTSGGRPFLSPGGAAGFGLAAGDDKVVSQNRGRQLFAEVSFRF